MASVPAGTKPAMLRIAGLIGCGLVVVVGALGALLFGLLTILGDGGWAARLVSAAFTAIALALVWAGRRGFRGLRGTPGPDTPSDAYMRAVERLSRGEALVLYPGRVRGALFLVLGGALLAGSVWLAASGALAIGIAGALLFGAGVLIGIVQFVPSLAHLRIAPEGLVLRHVGRTTRWSWNQLENFTPYEIHHRYGSVKQVGFDRRDLTPERQSLVQTITRGMSGVDGALPDTYGLRHQELADLLNAARERYATEHGPSPSLVADAELQRQAGAVRRDRLPVVTVALALVCAAAFVMEVSAYGPYPDTQELRDAGGASREALADGSWWTLLAANVLHAHPFHLVLNLAALLIVGILLEREVGWARFGLVCLAGGLASTSLGVLLQQGAGVVGVSGVVYAIAAWALLRDLHRTRMLGVVAWGILPAGIIYTFLVPGVSIGGHLGGLAAGLALGYLFERGAPERMALGHPNS